MKHIIRIAIPFVLALAASVAGPSALAQGMSSSMGAGRATGPGYEVTAEMQRYTEMGSLMRDMSQHINLMQERMAKGEMSPENQNRMRQQLKIMSDTMLRMSGLADRPSMNDSGLRKEAADMREQMDNMLRERQ